MSFAAPVWLLALLLVPLGVLAHHLGQRRARRFAIRFPAAGTLAAAAVGAGRIQRHVPLALLLAGVAALAVALARPHVSERVPVGEASVVLVTDHSGSMAASDVAPTRLLAAERAADTFLSRLPRGVRAGVVTFSTSPDASQAPVNDHSAVRSIVDGQSAGGATATGDALAQALRLLHGTDAHHPPSAIVLLSDGSANRGVDAFSVAQTAGRERIPIDTVALGTPGGVLSTGDPLQPYVPVPPDPVLMRRLALASGGTTFNARSAGELSSIYAHLGTQLGSTSRRREITAMFAAAGVALVLLAAAGSARIAGRLP